jgi:hypothetical protein
MKLIVSLRNNCYNEGLEALKLTTLETRWDLKQIFKIFKGFNRLIHGGFLR